MYNVSQNWIVEKICETLLSYKYSMAVESVYSFTTTIVVIKVSETAHIVKVENATEAKALLY